MTVINYWEEQGIPNPGSQEAEELGCTCAILDNAHGKGFPWPDKNGGFITVFWINEDCSIHGKERRIT